MASKNLKDLTGHFAFGENWQSYVNTAVDDDRIHEAIKGLGKLVSPEEIAGKMFFDIGCGSGMSMLAALKLGASMSRGIDIDPNSVNAAKMLLSEHAASMNWNCEQRSVFDVGGEAEGRFDIVHSWGVLHHTGAMWEAIDRAASLCKEDSLLILALYRKTRFCRMWKVIKRIYSNSPGLVQRFIAAIYKLLFLMAKTLRLENPIRYVKEYKKNRGMDWAHDVHDWLGGYPYESTNPDEVKDFLASRGFTLHREFLIPPTIGLFGTGCDEYVFKRGA